MSILAMFNFPESIWNKTTIFYQRKIYWLAFLVFVIAIAVFIYVDSYTLLPALY